MALPQDNSKGATLVEYAIIIVLVGFAILALTETLVRPKAIGYFDRSTNQLGRSVPKNFIDPPVTWLSTVYPFDLMRWDYLRLNIVYSQGFEL